MNYTKRYRQSRGKPKGMGMHSRASHNGEPLPVSDRKEQEEGAITGT